jgi:hypothetical protein
MEEAEAAEVVVEIMEAEEEPEEAAEMYLRGTNVHYSV